MGTHLARLQLGKRRAGVHGAALYGFHELAVGFQLELAFEQVEGVGVGVALLEDLLLFLELEDLGLLHHFILVVWREAADRNQRLDLLFVLLLQGVHSTRSRGWATAPCPAYGLCSPVARFERPQPPIRGSSRQIPGQPPGQWGAARAAYKMIFGRGIDSFKSNAVHGPDSGTASQNAGIPVIFHVFRPIGTAPAGAPAWPRRGLRDHRQVTDFSEDPPGAVGPAGGRPRDRPGAPPGA